MSRVLLAALVVAGSAGGSAAANASKVRVALTATTTAPNASGKALAVVRSPTKGRFEVKVKRLAANASYDLVVGGVKVATLQTSNGGSARVRFSSKPSGKELMLGFDPRGDSIEVRDGARNDVLTSSLPADPGSDPGDVTCCVPDDSGPECEDRTQAECAAQGGTMIEAASCATNPCQATPLPGDTDILCCMPNPAGDEIECEDRTADQCLAAGGVNKGVGVCAIDTCADVPPPVADIQCCVPDNSGVDCEDRTPAECTTRGGVDRGAGTCTPTSCAGL